MAWTYDEHDRCWILNYQGACVYLMPRAGHCDRGRWYAVVSGIGTLDFADAFPRYFMDLERAKAELGEWLVWRITSAGPPKPFDQWKARAMAVDELALAVSAVTSMQLTSEEGAATLRGIVTVLRANYGSARG